MTNPNYKTSDLGKLGEQLVSQWLMNQGWRILHHRWRCRWGEIDLIAEKQAWEKSVNVDDAHLIFVEVKTRKRESWDDHGLLAVSPQKQGRMWQTAELFLSQYPQFVNSPCRFDLALVQGQSLVSGDNPEGEKKAFPTLIEMKRPIRYQGYKLMLYDYLAGIS